MPFKVSASFPDPCGKMSIRPAEPEELKDLILPDVEMICD
jgi:hypothetical protein